MSGIITELLLECDELTNSLTRVQDDKDYSNLSLFDGDIGDTFRREVTLHKLEFLLAFMNLMRHSTTANMEFIRKEIRRLNDTQDIPPTQDSITC